MISHLDRFVAKTFLTSWFVAVVFFVGFFGLIDFFAGVADFIESLDEEGGTVGMILHFYLLKVPTIYLHVSPFVMLVATLVTITRLQRHNEFTAMLLTGRSSLRVLAPAFVMAGLFVLFQVGIQQFVAPRFALERDQLESLLLDHDEEWIIDEIHLRDSGGRAFQARNFNVTENVVERLFVSYRDENDYHVRIEGRNARYDEAAGGWRLSDGVMVILSDEPDAIPEEEPAAFFRSDIKPHDLLVDHLDPFDLSYGEVLEKSERYPNNRSYRLLRHYHVTYPISVMLLVMLGVPFVLRAGSGSMVGIGYSLALCMAFLLLDATSRDLGVRGILPWPAVAAWLPVIVAGSLVVVFYDAIEL